MHHDPFHQIIQIFFAGFIGALSSLALVFKMSGTLTTRLIIAFALKGIISGIAGFSLFVFIYPDRREDWVLVAGVSAVCGTIGIDFVLQYVRPYLEKMLGQHLPDGMAIEDCSGKDCPKEKEKVKIRDLEVSLDTKTLIDSGEFSQEEIARLMEEYRARKNAAKAKSDATET
jgi:hypothetical protein